MATKSSAGETGLDDLDLEAVPLRDARHIRRIIAARKALDRAEDELREAVAASRAAGDPWAMIGMALGISKQAAQQRFGR